MFEINNDFSADELMHMALYASEQGRHDHALMYLRTHALKEPDNAVVQLALGGQYAKLRHYDKALSALNQAATLDETLHIAHLHSAFILLATNQYAKAEQVLQPLLLLAESHYLYSLARGLVALCQADKAQTVHFLELGASQNQQDPLLNNDIEQLLIAIKATGPTEQTPTPAANPVTPHIAQAANNLLSSTYRKAATKN